MKKHLLQSLPSLVLAAAALGFTGVIAQPALGQDSGDPKAEAMAEMNIVRTTAKNAKVLNVADKNGTALVTCEVGQILHVAGERRGVGYLPVEAPGGFPVWVHGRNLKVTDTEGVLEITANAVNQRPLASSGAESYPLSLRLHRGDLVRVIERQDATKELAVDWIRIWSAPGSTGWILETEVETVTENPNAVWDKAMSELGLRTTLKSPEIEIATGKPATGTGAPAAPGNKEVQAAKMFDQAEALLATERIKPTPDFGAVRVAFEAVVALDAGERWKRDAESGLKVVSALEEAVALKSDLEAEKVRRQEDLLERQRRAWEESRQRDPMIGKFDARGVLERRSRSGEPHRYILRWGPDEVCEVRCASGKYDLDIFAGYEIGLKGLLEYAKPGALLEERPVLEVGKIEVLSKR